MFAYDHKSKYTPGAPLEISLKLTLSAKNENKHI